VNLTMKDRRICNLVNIFGTMTIQDFEKHGISLRNIRHAYKRGIISFDKEKNAYRRRHKGFEKK